MKIRNLFLAAMCLICCSVTANADSATRNTSFSELIAFGDSLSDTGNISFILGGLPLPPYAPGRISNGPVWLDVLADSLGLSSLYSLAGGGNYAYAGARTGPINAGLPPSLLDQVQMYLVDNSGVADPDALYVIWGGGNDVRENDAANSASEIAAMISDLEAAGATNFLVLNLPDIGMTPESLDGMAPGGPAGVITAATEQHNAMLAAELSTLSATLPVTIFELDIFTLFNQLLSDPADFGFSNVTDVCWTGDFLGNGTVCADPDSYVFWDDIHPTAAAHAILGASAANLIDPDTDSDGVTDDVDNCTLVANADQRDSNGDGFGNACDADLDDDGAVNFIDLGILKSVFFSADADADLNGDGAVNFLDLGIMKAGFFQPPGPSAEVP